MGEAALELLLFALYVALLFIYRPKAMDVMHSPIVTGHDDLGSALVVEEEADLHLAFSEPRERLVIREVELEQIVWKPAP